MLNRFLRLAAGLLVLMPAMAQAVESAPGSAPATAPPASGAIEAGHPTPDLTLRGDDGKPYPLRAFRGRWTVLAFYPADFTGGCTKEACSIRDDKAKIEAMDARVIGVSVQDTQSHKGFIEKNNLNFRLLADPDRQAVRAFGVLGPNSFARRTTFYLDPFGVIRKVEDKVDVTAAGPQIEAALKDLQARYPMPSLDEVNREIRRINRVLAKSPHDEKAKHELATYVYLKGYALEHATQFPASFRRTMAHDQYVRASELDPDLIAARESAETTSRPPA